MSNSGNQTLGLGSNPLCLEVQGSKVVHSNLTEVEGGPSWRRGQDSQPPAPLAQAPAQGPPPPPAFPTGRITPCSSGLEHQQSQAKAFPIGRAFLWLVLSPLNLKKL